MKGNFTRIIACVLTAATIACAITALNRVDKRNIYALSTTVYSVDNRNDVVTFEDANGNLWEYSGIEDWCVGDTAALVMYDNNTPLIYDDEIISARYCAN